MSKSSISIRKSLADAPQTPRVPSRESGEFTPAGPGSDGRIALGIGPVDKRLGGIEKGGSYLMVGPPGPSKMVAVLQFLHRGLTDGEQCALLTGADAKGILHAARGWGLGADEHWRDGSLTILGFRDDFELRAARTIAPEEVLEELQEQIPSDVARIAVDPGTLFLAGEGRTLLGGSFLRWAREQSATICTTYSVDTERGFLPSSADWLVHGTTGRFVVVPTAGGLFEMSLIRSIPHEPEEEAPISLQLRPGSGLVRPESYPARRSEDREGLDRNRLLILSLADENVPDLENWAGSAFDVTSVSDPIDAVSAVQEGGGFGSVLVYAGRGQVGEAVRACRALRPLTRAALVFASDDMVRSMDRIGLLEAGADDCVSGGMDFHELGLRLRQAMSSSARPLPDPGADVGSDGPGRRGGMVELDVFRKEALRRAGDSLMGVFCILEFRTNGFDRKRFLDVVEEQIRDEDGDLLTQAGGRAMVLLQGARASQAEPFVGRLRERLGTVSRKKKKKELAVEVLSHPSDQKRIRAVLEADGARSD